MSTQCQHGISASGYCPFCKVDEQEHDLSITNEEVRRLTAELAEAKENHANEKYLSETLFNRAKRAEERAEQAERELATTMIVRNLEIDSLQSRLSRYESALTWCYEQFPIVRESDDIHFGGMTIEELVEGEALAEGHRGLTMKYKVTGKAMIFVDTWIEDDGKTDLGDQAYDQIRSLLSSVEHTCPGSGDEVYLDDIELGDVTPLSD